MPSDKRYFDVKESLEPKLLLRGSTHEILYDPIGVDFVVARKNGSFIARYK